MRPAYISSSERGTWRATVCLLGTGYLANSPVVGKLLGRRDLCPAHHTDIEQASRSAAAVDFNKVFVQGFCTMVVEKMLLKLSFFQIRIAD